MHVNWSCHGTAHTCGFTACCLSLITLYGSLSKSVACVSLRCSVQLYQLTGRRGMAILYLYAFLGFGALHAVTPDFGALAKKARALP